MRTARLFNRGVVFTTGIIAIAFFFAFFAVRARPQSAAAQSNQLGEALGQLYVKEYFPPEAKARALKMVNSLIAALRDDLKTLPWMGRATRAEALAKLDAFTVKISYPDKWRDDSAYHVDRGPFVLDVLRGNKFESRRDLNKIGKPSVSPLTAMNGR